MSLIFPQVDLITPHVISAVGASGGATTYQYYIEEAKFHYSSTSPFSLDVIRDGDGGEQVFALNYRNDEPVLVTLNETVTARWFRIEPTDASTYVMLTMELYGKPLGKRGDASMFLCRLVYGDTVVDIVITF